MQDTWRTVAQRRVALADALASLQDQDWAAASLCRGWRAHDVLAHLVWLAEADRPGMFVQTTAAALRYRRTPLGAMVPIARRVAADAGPDELLDRLRASQDGRFVVPGAPPAAALAEVLVHGLDITRPLGRPDVVEPGAARLAVSAMRRFGPVYGVGSPVRRLRLTSTSGWSVPGSGLSGELVACDGDLLLLAAGRVSPDQVRAGTA